MLVDSLRASFRTSASAMGGSPSSSIRASSPSRSTSPSSSRMSYLYLPSRSPSPSSSSANTGATNVSLDRKARTTAPTDQPCRTSATTCSPRSRSSTRSVRSHPAPLARHLTPPFSHERLGTCSVCDRVQCFEAYPCRGDNSWRFCSWCVGCQWLIGCAGVADGGL